MTDRDRYEKEHAKPGQFFPDERKPDTVHPITAAQLAVITDLVVATDKLVAAAREVLRCYHPGDKYPSQMAPGLECNAALDGLRAAVEVMEPPRQEPKPPPLRSVLR